MQKLVGDAFARAFQRKVVSVRHAWNEFTDHPFGEAKRHAVEQFERDYLTDLMRSHGGNVTRASRISLTVTALGSVPRGRALTRGGGRPGHVLLVSGSLGGAALGRRRGAPARLRTRGASS